ncbi:MAG: hypothetical protein WBM56_11675, partial [Robiginitalea sp.]|uniref:hypothetical protein n=1 Tax=Robiginitalea sp. TaxID=1902411 RepID=UPI003C7924DE
LGLGFKGIFLFMTLAGSCLFGQKQVTKTLLNPEINAISIDGALAYEVELITEGSQEVSVEARMEGEYGSDLMVLFKESGTTLFIETRFGPNFKMPNDKLGAHKVISVKLKVTLPEYQNVFLSGASCQINTSGVFRNLDIVFNDGGCDLYHQAENTEVTTGSGPITAYLKSGVVDAQSKYGTVLLEPIPVGSHHLKLYSTRGDISVKSL